MKQYLLSLFTDIQDKFEYLHVNEISFDIPKIETHGDYSTNIAMLIGRKTKKTA
ncbi:MAG: hypothetical protein IPG53_01500 [Ignavibacteriales bacterium]|nr:hypothetical protein [Ignavibacteriales bacterium]